jgi:Protein of unknown function (DUF4013)
MVNYEQALKKPFTDFKKLIIGILLNIIPIVDFTFVTGFQMECSGLGRTKQSNKMPEWKQWKYLFLKGLGALGIKIVYMIPALLVIGIGVLLFMADILQLLVQTFTPAVIFQIEHGMITSQQVWQMFWQNNWYVIIPAILKVSPLLILGAILALFAKFLSPLAILNYLKKRRFGAGFEFGLVARKAFTKEYILAVLAIVLVAIVLGSFLLFVPFVGAAILSFLVGVMGYGLIGQVYKETK